MSLQINWQWAAGPTCLLLARVATTTLVAPLRVSGCTNGWRRGGTEYTPLSSSLHDRGYLYDTLLGACLLHQTYGIWLARTPRCDSPFASHWKIISWFSYFQYHLLTIQGADEEQYIEVSKIIARGKEPNSILIIEDLNLLGVLRNTNRRKVRQCVAKNSHSHLRHWECWS